MLRNEADHRSRAEHACLRLEGSYPQIHEAIRALVKRAIKSGDIRKDLDPMDLLWAIVGVANVSASPDWQQSARRLVDILIAGARPMK